jgi:hypothetical protein
MVKETQSVRIDPVLWRAVKQRALDLDTSISEYLESIIKKDLGRK